ncbi:ricin-type beta-trefoil lectin domain-containing protein [Favolaschia claudopus]|uniref:Ricin-type beta-trefoil lectin domain-containing protein n=1 Tax=Favolaschia claudopus TaxID=2862362 RepID=A0AAW0AH08_9AGAR
MAIFKGDYTITNLQSKTRVDLKDGNNLHILQRYDFESHNTILLGNNEDGTRVHGWEPLTSKNEDYLNQVWHIMPTDRTGADSHHIVNVGTGTYLEIGEGNTTDGTPVTCSNKAAEPTPSYQEWEFIKIKDNYYKARNLGSGTYLEIDEGSSANGAKIQGRGEVDTNENQLWVFDVISAHK